ncbi:PqqD family protein [bacterium]|nr:PqqD family protein [bacterium]
MHLRIYNSFDGFPMGQAYRQVEDIEVNTVKDGFVLYDPKSNTVHFLNHSAMIVWELCTGTSSEAEIISLFQELYTLDNSPADMVKNILEDMTQKGLIVQCQS